MAHLTLGNITKVYPNGHQAVRGASLEIADGEFVVLVGPSGCGKSTVLRMIAGLEEVTSGTIAIGGRVVNTVEPKDRDIAMVFQNYALYPHMSVRKNMGFALAMRGMPKDQVEARVRDAARALGLQDVLDRKPGQLSGGQRQRVAVGRAIVRKPAVFLFDEPLSNLDAKLRVSTRGELKALHQRLSTTSVYVTHDQEEAMTLGDRIAVMHDGLIRQCGTPLEVYNAPANRFVAGFIGTPGMNFIQGSCAEVGGALWFEASGGQRASDARFRVAEEHEQMLRGRGTQRTVLGLRPQAFLLGAGPEDATLDVAIVEPLGDVMDVTGTLGGTKVVMRAPMRGAMVRPGPCGVRVAMEQAHWFEEGEQGARLAQ